MAKHKLLAGLILGGAAYAAYQALDLEKREALKDMVRKQGDALKDRAVDYAFYAADTLDDFKENLHDHLDTDEDDDEPEDWRTASDESAEATDDDIVLSSDQVSSMDSETATESETDSSESTAATDTASEASTSATTQPGTPA